SLFRLCSDCLILGHLLSFLFFFISLPPAPRSTLFPYTTLFRSALALWEFRGLSGQMGYLAPTWLLYPLGVYFTFSGTLLKAIDLQLVLSLPLVGGLMAFLFIPCRREGLGRWAMGMAGGLYVGLPFNF